MESLAFILVAAGIYILRQTFIGRGPEIGTDTVEMLSEVASGNYAGAAEVFKKKADTPIFGTTSAATGGTTGTTDATGSNTTGTGGTTRGLMLLNKMRALGNGRPYVWGATGPNSYDCSGLVWRAMKETGIYTGARFTTGSFNMIAGKFASQISGPEPGAVCNWAGTHMGVCVSKTRYYSALNRKLGIIESALSSEIANHGNPTYWRIKES